MDEKRFRITLRDITGIDIGVVLARFNVVAESAAEAEMYVRQYIRTGAGFSMAIEEIPTLS